MKKLLFIPVFIFLMSCEKDDENLCDCSLNTYQFGKLTISEYYSDDCEDDGLVLGNANNVKRIVECK